MFQEGNYEVTELSVPVNGMNQFVSPDILPSNFCYLLENIIPSPTGVGQARYGTELKKVTTVTSVTFFLFSLRLVCWYLLNEPSARQEYYTSNQAA